jgi:tetratricopeptide (TPR) repeat protein
VRAQTLGVLVGLALLLAGCGQRGAAPAADASPAQAAPDIDAAMTTCSSLGGDNATRIAACTSVIGASGAPAQTRARAMNNRGVLTLFQGDPDGAIADYSAAIQIDPTYATAFYNRAKAWRQKGDSVRADADAAEAVRLDPNLAGR